MIITKKNMSLLLLSLFLLAGITGCSTVLSSKPPLPETLNIIFPSTDIPPEIAAFSGIWEGKWGSIQDAIIVIEKIDTKTAEVIMSFGKAAAGISSETSHYYYLTATVLPGPILEWNVGERLETDCPCTVTLKMDKGLNSMSAFYTFNKTKLKYRADLKRR
jgi:hypothetical protein